MHHLLFDRCSEIFILILQPEEDEARGGKQRGVWVSLEGCIIFLNRVESGLEAGLWRFSFPLPDYHF